MKKQHIALISASIFIVYGIITHKWSFLGFGVTFAFIALARYLKQK
ncbi:hypothetical protein [Streptococcus fryi]